LNAPFAHRLLLTLIPAFVLGLVVLSTVWGENGLTAQAALHAQLADANAQLASVERENQRLLHELDLMEKDPVVLERMVADELEWAREDATIYRFPVHGEQ